MRKYILIFAGFGIFLSQTVAQTTALRVYQIMQANCTTSGCHNNADQAASLDLEGTGATEAARMSLIYGQINFGTPQILMPPGLAILCFTRAELTKVFCFEK